MKLGLRPIYAAMALALSLGPLVTPTVAAADPRGDETAAVLPTMAAGHDDAVPDWVVRQVERDIALRGTRTLRSYEAARRFAEAHSEAPLDHETGALEHLHSCAQRSLFTVAMGQYRQARTNAAQCVREAERALESINRESAAAEDLLNSCLYVVRALIAMRQDAAARSETHRCRVMVPDLTPSGVRHPPEVVEMVASVDEALSRTPHRLIVETTEPGCGVYLNGRRLGSTPLTLDSLHVGTYRLQVECDPDVEGRVHEIEITAPEQRLVVDTRYERSIQTYIGPDRHDGSIALRYDDVGEEARMRLSDAVRTAALLDLEEVWLVERESARGTLRIDRVLVESGEVLASGRLAFDSDGDGFRGHALGEVVVAMARGNSLDASGDRTARMARWTPAPDAAELSEDTTTAPSAMAERRRSPVDTATRQRRAGLSLAIVGAASVGGGLALWASRVANEDPFMDIRAPRRIPHLTLMGTGAALLTASIPLWLPETRGTPWWSYVLGGVGIAAIGAGIAIELRDRDGGVDASGAQLPSRERFDLGYTLILAGAPLLTVPITHLARGGGVELGAATTHGGAQLTAAGRF